MAVMSKLSIRARNVDSNKNLPIIRSEDLPDLNECSILPKNVTLFSTGMEKEEEEETHLQEALSALQFGLREKEDASSRSSFIPIPESNIGVENYQELYSTTVKYSKQYIQYREKLPEETIPDYDADSEDEEWLEASFSFNASKTTLTKSIFEGMMEKLEKSSGQQVTSAADAKALLKGDDDIVMQVYDYWLAKRLRWRQALLPAVKVDRRDLVGDPYVAFRRRMDRVQTRKNRKNDEISYEKMLRLRKDFHRALEIIELMKERESTKHLLLGTEVDVVNLRKRSDEISSVLYREILQMVKIEMENRELTKTQSFASKPVNGLKPLVENNVMTERKRKKLRRDSEATKVKQDKVKSEVDVAVKSESWDAPAKLTVRQFAFKRDPSMSYQAGSSVPESNLWPNVHLSYSLTNISTEGANQHSQNTVHQFIDTNRNIGYCRRRIGRGGRVMFDRIRYPEHLDAQTTSDQLQLGSEQQGCNLDTRNLPNEFWSHYLDHSYSIVCDSLPTEIPVYLPTAKRHQSLPPSCDLRAIGSFSTAEHMASAMSNKPGDSALQKMEHQNKKNLFVTGAGHATLNGTWSLANGSQGVHKTETWASFQTAMLENVSDDNISYHNMVANCKKAQSPHSQFNSEAEPGQIYDTAPCNGLGGIWMENQSTERPNNLRDNQTFLSHKRSVSMKTSTKPLIRGSKNASSGPALVPTTGSIVLDGGARNVEMNRNRRGSNTAALLLNGEKGFGQVVPMQQQQMHFNYTAPEYWVNNNNKSEVTRMSNGGIEHEMDGNMLLMPQAKQSQTQLQVYKASQMSSVTKRTSASLQPSNVGAGNAPHQHESLTSFTGSIIS